MASIVHFSKQDATLRTGTAGGTTAQEVTEYTVAYADLTGAGFAAGDDVLIFAKANVSANSITNNAEITWGIGTTFAGRSILQTNRTESNSGSSTVGGREFMFLDRHTLAANENFYVSIRIISTSTPFIEDFCFFAIKLDDLAADDFRYATHTSSGNQSTTPDDGASVTLPASGGDDWLVLAAVRWLCDSTSAAVLSELSLGGATRMPHRWEGEDTDETFDFGLIGYLPAAGSSAVCKVVKSVSASSTHDYTRSAIFALRLDAFADHVGNYTAGPVATGGVVDTYVETNSVSLGLSATGPVAWFAQTIADCNGAGQSPYHRVQVDGADIVSELGRKGSSAYDALDDLQVSQFGTISMSSGTRVIDMDCAEGSSTTDYNFTDSTLVAFSMELAGGGGGYTLACDAGAFVLTGTAASTEMGRAVATESGAFAITGTAAELIRGRTLAAESGAFVETGTDATLTADRRIEAQTDGFALTGTAASLEHGRRLAADAGAFAHTGSDAALERGFMVEASSGAVIWTGTTATLARSFLVGAEAGSYTVSGQDAMVERGYAVGAGAGAFLLSGEDATLTYAPIGGFTITAESGTLTLTGSDSSLEIQRKALAESGSVAIVGQDAGLRHDKRIDVSSGGFAVTGSTASLLRALRLQAASGAFDIAGSEAGFLATRYLVATPGAFSFSGQDAGLTYSGAEVVVGGEWIITARRRRRR